MVKCQVSGCNHNKYKNSNCKHFFRFPKDHATRKKWLELLGKKDTSCINAVVCSCHFVDDKKENLPTLFLFREENQWEFLHSSQECDPLAINNDLEPKTYEKSAGTMKSPKIKEPSSVEDSCRLCGESVRIVGIDIFTENVANANAIADRIFRYLNLTVSADDKLPKKICGQCNNKLANFKKFSITAATAVNNLKGKAGICRLCGANDECSEIFSAACVKSPIAHKIRLYLHLSVSKSDSLPKTICNRCVEQLDEIHALAQTASAIYDVYSHSFIKMDLNNSEIFIKQEPLEVDFAIDNLTTVNIKEVGEIDRLCRLCTRQINDTAIEIFSVSHIAEQIHRYLPFSVSEEDELPQVLCNACIEKLGDIDRFVNEAELAQSKLRRLVEMRKEKMSHDGLEVKLIESSSPVDEQREKNEDDGVIEYERVDNAAAIEEYFQQAKQQHSKIETSCNEASKKIRRIIECAGCKSVFSNWPDLWAHYKNPQSMKKFKCCVCNEEFTQKGNLNRHNDRKHNTSKPLQCPYCPKQFSKLKAKECHVERHNDGTLFWECDLCKRQFTLKYMLRKHLMCHLGEKPYKCLLCSKSFLQRSHLADHERVHTGQKPHQCNYCGRMFRVVQGLHTHERMHRGERPYQCDVCGKCFVAMGQLRNHVKLHLGIKPHRCDYCQQQFLYRRNKEVHERQHTGERPFGCPMCEKRFAGKFLLKCHLEVHSGVKPFVCGVCDKAFRQSAHLREHQATKMCQKKLAEMRPATMTSHSKKDEI